MILVPGPELLVHSLRSESDERAAWARGVLVRLLPGRYIRTLHWKAFDARERYLMLSFAALSALQCEAVLSHASAAAFWGIPRLGAWPTRVQVTVTSARTSTANRWTYKHASALADGEIHEYHGILVTTPLRTAVDLARVGTFRQAIVTLDHGLHARLFTPEELDAHHDERRNAYGSARALRAIRFADGRACRPGESLSRVVMHEDGFEPPDLQRKFADSDGAVAFADFFWERCGRLGEFDGEVKYRNARMRAGRSPEQVVIDEKNRENWLARQPGVERIVRWDWRTALMPGSLARILTSAGVPRRASRVSRT